MISIIVAVAENNVIGKNNKLLWHIPRDMKHFKETTMGHHIISGRKTFESFGKPLPKRTNIIVTRNNNYTQEGCIIVNSLEDALDYAKNDTEIFIIGGGEIYKQALNFADRIYLTKVHHSFDGDTFFPEINPNNWKETDRKKIDSDEKNKYPISIITLNKI
ncbi:MAG: dihydrofolate reductase [Bacteroidales bacterium]|jgi:dihydrofolate reductase|nr:dihydrofolate reductase [Bacteroidales bacterium]